MENQKDMDLEIAKIIKEEKKKEELENSKNIEEYNENSETEAEEIELEEELPTQEEIDEAVEQGLVEWKGKKFEFKRVNFFENGFSFMFPFKILELEKKDKVSYVFTNFSEGINCLISYAETDRKINIVKAKENILQNFKKSKIKSNCPEEGVKRVNGEKVGYCIIENKIPAQDIFNLMFFVEVAEGYVIVNFNGFTKEYDKLWALMYKAMINTIELEN